MKYHDALKKGIDEGTPPAEVARKLYLCYPTSVFVDQEDLQFEILDDVSNHFGIPFMNVQVVGSAKSGFSYFKNYEFKPGDSDLDLAIIDNGLFTKYSEIAYLVTEKYTNLTFFSSFEYYKSFVKYLAKGIMRPDMMPNCPEKTTWFEYFNKLSSNYFRLFKDINAGVYSNQFFFERKVESVVEDYRRYIK